VWEASARCVQGEWCRDAPRTRALVRAVGYARLLLEFALTPTHPSTSPIAVRGASGGTRHHQIRPQFGDQTGLCVICPYSSIR
jgi:hypothetical protein